MLFTISLADMSLPQNPPHRGIESENRRVITAGLNTRNRRANGLTQGQCAILYKQLEQHEDANISNHIHFIIYAETTCFLSRKEVDDLQL